MAIAIDDILGANKTAVREGHSQGNVHLSADTQNLVSRRSSGGPRLEHIRDRPCHQWRRV